MTDTLTTPKVRLADLPDELRNLLNKIHMQIIIDVGLYDLERAGKYICFFDSPQAAALHSAEVLRNFTETYIGTIADHDNKAIVIDAEELAQLTAEFFTKHMDNILEGGELAAISQAIDEG